MSTNENSTAKNILEKGKAGYPGIYLLSPEDARSIGDIKIAARQMNRKVFVWSFGRGFVEDDPNASHNARPAEPIADTESPAGALAMLLKDPAAATTPAARRAAGTTTPTLPPTDAVFVFRLFHHFLDDPMIQTMVTLLTSKLKVTKRMMVVLTPTLKIPGELEKEFALLETSLPGEQELNEVLDGIALNLPQGLQPPADMRKRLIESALGLTTSEAENAFGLAIVRPRLNGSEAWDPEVVMAEKCQSLRKTGLLQYYPPSVGGLSQVGGMDQLKSWVQKREAAFTKEAKDFGLRPPRGLLVLGIPGTGKSLCAKAVAEELKLPLLRCDMGRIFAGIVGQSEENVRKVTQIAERLAPCVLWIDELEKGVAGSSSGNLDSGVGARVFGSMLTWMQEKTAPVFVFATANDVSALPPELLRKGRFDEIFSVTLPTPKEREEIFKIHVAKRDRGHLIDRLQIPDLAERTEGYSGAEIEGCIDEAMFNAFHAKKRTGNPNTDLNFMDLVDAIDSTIPLSRTMRAKIDALEEWCKTRTRPASSPPTIAQAQGVPGGRVVDAN